MTTAAAAPQPDAAEIRAALSRVLESAGFRTAQRPGRLLRFLVEAALDGHAATLKEYVIGTDALERPPDFDPRTDPIVRVEVSRLRSRLAQYYVADGADDPVRIVLPRGTYVPRFEFVARTASTVERGDRDVPEHRSGNPAAKPAKGHPSWRSVVAGAAVTGALVLAVLLLAAKGSGGGAVPAAAPLLEVPVTAGIDGVAIGSEVGNDFTVDHAGRLLVFVGRRPDGATSLFVRSLDTATARELPGTRGARVPVLSPSGDRVIFWAEGEVRMLRTDGTGGVDTLRESGDLLGGSWGGDDRIVLAPSPYELVWINPQGHELGRRRAPPGVRRVWPQVIDGGRFVLLTAEGGQMGRATIELLDVATGESRPLVRGALFGRYVATGHLLYLSEGTVFAVPFDLPSGQVRGDAHAIASGVAWSATFGYAQFAASDTGLLAYRRGGEAEASRIAWIDPRNQAVTLPAIEPGAYNWPRLSPDARQLAVTRRDGDDFDLWLYDIASGKGRKLVDLPFDLQSPVWMPGGHRMVFGTRGEVRWADTDRVAGGTLLPAPDPAGILVPWSFSPSGDRLAYYARGPDSGFDLFTVAISDGDGGPVASTPVPLLRTAAFETFPAFSPDGRHIANASNESGRWEVYVRSFPAGDRVQQVSADGGRHPVWAGNSRRLVFQTLDRRLQEVAYEIDPAGRFVAGRPRELVAHPLADTGVIPNYDVAADGRVLALLPLSADVEPEVVLLSDFRRRIESQPEE